VKNLFQAWVSYGDLIAKHTLRLIIERIRTVVDISRSHSFASFFPAAQQNHCAVSINSDRLLYPSICASMARNISWDRVVAVLIFMPGYTATHTWCQLVGEQIRCRISGQGLDIPSNVWHNARVAIKFNDLSNQ
jgi:hypothetical protein